MAKLYSKCPQKNDNLNPKDETVDLLLNYSKALSIVRWNDRKFELILN